MSSIGSLAAVPLFAVALLPAFSCSRESGGEGAARSAEPAMRALAHEEPPAPSGGSAAAPELPPSGEVVIVPSGEALTVLASQVSVTRLLERLSSSVGFELVVLDLEDRPVDVLAVGATMADVLAQALEGVPYTVRFDVRDGHSRLASLVVGAEPDQQLAGRERGEGSGRAEERKLAGREKDERTGAEKAGRADPEEARARAGSPGAADLERRARFLAGRPEREAARRADALADLESSDASTRRSAVQMLDPDSPDDAERLARICGEDGDYRVRVAAVEQLELADSRAAVAAVTGALSDPEAEVVLAAVKALRLLGDASAVPRVQPLLEHESGEVRSQAAALVELLQKGEPAE